jgi:hypothetical protein
MVDMNGRKFFINDDGSVESADSMDPTDFDPDLKYMSLENFHIMLTNKFKAVQTLKKTKKAVREITVSPSHWWMTMPADKKIQLISELAEKIEEILTHQIVSSPTNKLNDYYMTLQDRVRYGTIVLHDLTPKDICKLPSYDSLRDKFYGTPVQILKLIALCYPANRKRRGSKYW